ncbi:MAG TPA: hypothetical protein VHD90_05660 [Phototrophicaceae bacterium]|nr:hypothetical protein [Phototrophicaceae bacterium]
MNEPHDDWETRIQHTARGFAYPPTPDLATSLRRRRQVSAARLAQIAAILLLLLIGLTLAVPGIRAQVIALFHIGAVDVIVTTATPPAQFTPGADLPSSVLDFPGATSFDDAQRHFGYPIPLPSALGVPDRVYLIQASKPIVALAWLDANGAVDVSLQLFPPDTYLLKMTSGTPEPTNVNGADALWITGQHWYMLHTMGDAYQLRVVDMPALIWSTADGMTDRLETKRSLAEALTIAESIPTGTPGK